jgi:hypothetical protein
VGRSEATFDDHARDRSNRGDSLAFDLSWKRRKLGASISVREREVEGEPGSEFGRFSGSTGTGRITWAPRDRSSFAVYGLRDLAYTALDESAWFLDERLGGELGFRVGHRIGLTLFTEAGERRFDGGGVDDVTSIGGSVAIELGKLGLRVGARRTELEGVHGDTSYTEIQFGASYGKLRGAWY